MNDKIISEMKKLIPEAYVKQASEVRSSNSSLITELIEKRKCPNKPWTEDMIELLLRELSLMDSNNFRHNIGVGEREARIYSGIVAKRHYGFGHGIGRSGDLTEVQPKAAGSSLIYKLTNSLVLHAVQECGIKNCKACLTVPMATGMSLALCLMYLKKKRRNAKYVLWPRIDQKSCFKAITATGCEPIIVENLIEGDELRTNVAEIKDKIISLGPDNIVAVLTTTGCFAPRGMDKVEEVAKVCLEMNIPHLINNAYGLQSSKCTHHIDMAARFGRVDFVVQSSDKNFMVPVGGAVIAGFDEDSIKELSKTYPGRASSSPILDLFVTLLQMGMDNFKNLLRERKAVKMYMDEKLLKVAEEFDLKVLRTPNNPISIAMTLPADLKNVTEIGSKLYFRGISGGRVLDGKKCSTIDGFEFKGWGTHRNDCSIPYLTASASIGLVEKDVDAFIACLRKVLKKVIPPKTYIHSPERGSLLQNGDEKTVSNNHQRTQSDRFTNEDKT